jgi:hypothetical protein
MPTERKPTTNIAEDHDDAPQAADFIERAFETRPTKLIRSMRVP